MINFINNLDITLVLADDHEVVRAGLRRLLSIDKRIQILAEAQTGKEAVELVAYHKPDIALIDILMPVMNGIDATIRIKENSLETKVIVLTAFEDHLHIEKALEAGADGYLSKDISAKKLVESIHDVMLGNRVFSKSILRLMQNRYYGTDNEQDLSVTISSREQEILNLVALGKTSNQIADELSISVRTVQSHRANVMAKLGIKTAAGLIRYAVLNYKTSKFDQKA